MDILINKAGGYYPRPAFMLTISGRMRFWLKNEGKTINNRLKAVSLWILFLFGIIFHNLLEMMPLFWGQSIAMSQDMINQHLLTPMLWMSLLIYLFPMIMIAVTIFIEAKWYKITNFVFTLLFTLMNIWHLGEHLSETPVNPCQIVLLTFVLISGVLLNTVSFKWLKE